MLPAKFRGFASRVGRLASRALAWHKTSERDAAVLTSSTASTSSTAVTSGNVAESTTTRTARPSHTLRRALFAMLVSAATIVTMLIVPPVHNAKADQAWWDKSGNGFFTHNGYWVGDANRDIDLSYPEIETVNDNGRIRRKITWKVTFNANGLALKRMGSSQFSGQNIGNQKSDGQFWDGRSYIYVYLPSGIDDSSVHIYREKTTRKFSSKETSFKWSLQGDEKNPGEFNSGSTRWTYLYRDGWSFQNDWNKSLGNLGEGKDPKDQYKDQFDTCEVKKWKDHGDFSRMLISRESGDTVLAYRWTVSAYIDDSVTVPENLPFIAGFRSNNSDKHKFAAMGPYDTDGDGFPDLWEHAHHTNPDSSDELQYPEPKGVFARFDDGKDYNAVYGKPYSQKPFMYTGEWVGNSVDGHFEYYKDKNPKPTNPKDYKTEDIPQNGIAYTFADQKIPDGVRRVYNINNMQDGDVYLNEFTGEVIYKTRKQDAGKTITFNVQINYPDPSFYNCKKSRISKIKKVVFKVKKMSQLYNPVYATKDMYAGTQDFSDRPTSDGSSGSIKGPLPEGTTFAIGKYNHGIEPLSWSAIQPQDTKTGSVYFYPNKWLSASKPNDPYKTPVIVTYPDGSKSTDEDSITKGNPVYAKVNLKRHDPGTGDLQLHIHKNQNGQEINYNDGFVFRKNRSINPTPWIDSWSVQEPGDINIRSVCADMAKPTSPQFYLDGINGIKISGEKPWPHATDEEQEKCRNGQGCAANKLFDSTGGTMERTRGSITGNPPKTGNYQCTVYALKPKALKKFEDAAKKNKDISSKNGSSTNIINPGTFKGLREGIDYTSRTVPIGVHSDAHYYNPQYVKVNVKAGHKGGVTSDAPVSQRGANGVKDDDKSQNDLVANGTRLPKGTWFELKKYSKHTDSKDKLSWSSFEGKQSNKKSGKAEPEDTTSEEMYGKVTFAPSNGTLTGKYDTPVIVHYPDGSTSEDPDSGNLGKPVYASVAVTDQDIQDDDLKLKVYSQYGGRRIDDNDKNGMRFRKGDTLGDKSDDTYKPMFFDSWSSAKPGKIYQRMLCYKLGAGNKRSGYEIDGINGLKLAGREGNTTNGKFTKQPSQWTRANNDQKNECNKNKGNCKPNLYLYGDERDTVERTWGWLHGKVQENGDFVCTVYAIKDLENKEGKHGDLQKKFDKAVADFVKKPDNRNFEDVIKTVLKDQKGKDKPLEATQRHIDWDSVTFPINVHPDAHYYNPKYEEVNKLQAGETGTSKLPKSVKNANGAKNNQDAVKNNEPLPDGTWFEFKQYTKDKKPNGAEPLNYAFFENDDDNVKNEGSKKSAKNGTGQFGNVTFHPHRWINANRSDNAPVVVHYPDGSTSEDPDSGNNGNPVYAKVNVVPHNYNPGDLSFDVTNNFNNGGWADKTIKIKKGDPLTNSHPRRLNLWSTHKPGKIELRTICHKIIHKNNTADTTSEYTWNGIAGIAMENPSIWDHQEDPQKQHKCYGDKKQCDAKLLYDDYVINGNSRNTTERTRASLVGTANKSGDYECVVYAIKQGSELLNNFDKAVQSIKPDKSGKATSSDTDPLKDFKWKLDGDTGKKDAVKGVDYEYRAIQIQIHNDNHFYNPKYVDVNVTAGQKVENAVPQSVKSANGADKYQDAVKAGALPDGTWFEFKDATHGFEVNNDGTKGNSVSLDWSYWASGNATDKTGEQSNKPDNPSKQKNGKHSAKDDGTRYGKVTFHPDQSVAPKSYFKEIVIHYPDGSTSDEPDSGNNGNPVYAKVTVSGLGSGADKDLKMTLLRSQDADPVDTLGGGHSLTVMSGTSLTKNPYVRAWSLKDRSNISLRMMCTKQGEQKWSRGLDDTLNMHLNQDYGNGVQPWKFADANQRKSCSENSNNCMANLLYGFTKNKDPNSIESAVSRSEDDIAGVPQKAGNYTCAVFALKPNALTVFNGLSSSEDMKKVQLTGLSSAVDWNRISFDVNVIDPPKFSLPKTGGMNWNVLLGAFAVIGTGVMAAGFFLEQTKWGRAMLDALLRKTLLKDFICKTAKKLRALRQRCERWGC
ncbi:Rib/alpha-like domain-containing protein [Gardnerella swidsinskii]|uniref:Rib/alpha-like domain-containing protein n=1 Tax=Gardnerella swidsinskii TaxID=2792979 RepID=UPI0036F4A40E